LLSASAPFVHRAVLYGNDAEAAVAVVTQVTLAMQRGDPAVVVLGPALRRAVEESLGDAVARRVHFRDLTDVHTDSVDSMIANYLRIVDDLLDGGRVSTIVEYDHEHPHDGTHDFCYRVEAAVNVAAAHRPVDNTCLHDLRAASGRDVAAVRETHPLLVVGGVESANPDLGDPPPVPTFVVVRPEGLTGLRAWVGAHAPDLHADVRGELVLVVNEVVSAVLATGTGAWVDLADLGARVVCRVRSRAPLPVVDGDALRRGLPIEHLLHDLAFAVHAVTHVVVRPMGSGQGFEIRVSR
jgi:hypothetical protein